MLTIRPISYWLFDSCNWYSEIFKLAARALSVDCITFTKMPDQFGVNKS